MDRKDPMVTGILQGIAFGTMDGVINVLGVMVGLGLATNSKLAVVVGILTAGFANALANSTGFYVSEETEAVHTRRELLTFAAFAFGGSFGSALVILAPFAFLTLRRGTPTGLALGLFILVAMAILVHPEDRAKGLRLGLKYTAIGLIVAVAGAGLGLIGSTFE